MLTLVVFLPLVGIPLLLVWPRMNDETAKWIALLVTLATFLVSLGVLGRFDGSRSGFQLVQSASWVGSLAIRYEVGVDGVSLFMLLLTSFLMPLSILASWKNEKSVRLFMASMLLLETGMLGTFVALDLLLFFLFFEAILLPMYLIIGAWGGERRVYAAIKFFLYTMAGSALLLLAILFLYFKADGILGHPTLDLAQLAGVARQLPTATQRWLFAAFFVAFAVKVPVFPLHTWLPDAHTEAPTRAR